MVKFTAKEFDELMTYVYLEGTEIGDYLSSLACLWEVPESHGKSPALSDAVNIELKNWLKRFRNEAKIIEVVVPQPDRVCKELEWR